MTTATDEIQVEQARAPRAVKGRWRSAVVGGAVLAIILVFVLAQPDDDETTTPLLEGLDPRTLTYIGQHDEAAATLERERSLIAEQESSSDLLPELAEVLEAAGQRYAAVPAPDWLVGDVAVYLDALEAERVALLEAHAALEAGEDARDALQRALELRSRSDNLAASLRGTALVHPAGR